jgi:hypothetical protein
MCKSTLHNKDKFCVGFKRLLAKKLTKNWFLTKDSLLSDYLGVGTVRGPHAGKTEPSFASSSEQTWTMSNDICSGSLNNGYHFFFIDEINVIFQQLKRF